MTEEQDPTTNYIKGYNTGYTMQKHELELLQKILSSTDKATDYIKALKAGQEQFELEKIRQDIEQSKTNQKDVNRDR